MTLEFEEAVKVLEEHIEILKHNLLFLMAERKPESIMTQKIITIKSELDKAVQERMKLCQIYSRQKFFFFFLYDLSKGLRNGGVVSIPLSSSIPSAILNDGILSYPLL